MEAKIQKWGNSLGVRIPATLARELQLTNGSVVEIAEEADGIIIRRKDQTDLDTLLDAITDENLHEEIDFGGPEGNEVW